MEVRRRSQYVLFAIKREEAGYRQVAIALARKGCALMLFLARVRVE